jgi:methyl acetate hydrolase
MKKMAALMIPLAGALVTLRAIAAGPADIDTLLRTAVEQKRVPLVVAMVADASGVVYEHATGVRKDDIFAIASMTKPVTSVAVMQLVESGKVKLDEPASTYVAELRDVQVLDSGTLRPPKRPVTVRHLLTHTSGFGYEFSRPELAELVGKKQIPSAMEGNDGFLKAPLLFDPGTRWEYGISTDWLGRLVERVSGQSLEVYFRDHIFAPLGMSDSFFVVPTAKQSRMVAQFQRTEKGLVELPRKPMAPVTFFSGGGGLFSTGPDYMRFVSALMAGGQLDKRRILTADTVALMGKNQIGGLTLVPVPSLIPQLIAPNAMMPGGMDKFGLGFAVNSKAGGTRGTNTMTWAGVFNTFFWIDREKQVGAVLFMHMLPGLEPGTLKLLEEFDRGVYAWKKGGSSAPQ